MSKVLSPRNMPRHWPPCCKSVGLIFRSRDHRNIPIESSEMNLHSNPRFPINANQIKWFKTHIVFLDFDWCPREAMLTLHFKWTSIGSLGWIAWPPCKASILTMGWVENTHSAHDLVLEPFQWPTELHILFHYGAMNILELLYQEINPLLVPTNVTSDDTRRCQFGVTVFHVPQINPQAHGILL